MTASLRSAGILVLALTLATILALPTAAQRQPAERDNAPDQAAAAPPYCIAQHDVGQLVVGVTNFGMVGIGKGKGERVDCLTGIPVPKGEYPKGSNTVYLYKGGLWVGGIVGRDTLLSHGAEFNTLSREFHPSINMQRVSSLDFDSPNYEFAVSEQDYYATYADTFYRVGYGSWDAIDRRPHKPLGIEVDQASYAWSYGHTDDFIIITYRVRNISNQTIKDVWAGMYWDADVHLSRTDIIYVQPESGKPPTDGDDDLAGFIWAAKSPFEICEDFRDTIGLAWTADNDGDPKTEGFETPAAGGIRLLGRDLTDPDLQVNYNWWVYNYNSAYDFGPQTREKFRDLGNGPGTPWGDRNRHYLMSNGERDYDMVRTYGISQNDPLWTYPSQRIAGYVTTGADVQQVLSVGPRDMLPGGVFDFAVAFVIGDDFHLDPGNLRQNIWANYEPDLFYDNLGFDKLVQSAVIAGRVYDIPGVDTNGDGYRGKFRICVFDSQLVDDRWVYTVADTSYYEGDGIPDLKAAAPPPKPEVWLTPTLNGITIRFNGQRSETVRDAFSNDLDFEGYRVYIARDNREESFSVVGQWDHDNYDKYIFTDRQYREGEFVRIDNPFSLEELRCLYGTGPEPCEDSTFDPLMYTQADPYIHPDFPGDSVFYFNTHDYNMSEFGKNTPITKVYPDQPPPTSVLAPEPEELTEDGYLKYYEYEMTVENLLPNVPYWVAVTAFDYGSPKAGLAPLESSKTLESKSAYPNNRWDEKADSLTNVYVYPNPYRQDGWYRQIGYEGRGMDNRSRDRVRKVTFGNLPARCTISIFTLDGDLVRRMEHDVPPGDPNSSYHEWDLVSRNVQMIVSGMYYWVVEDPNGETQIGKLVILL